MAMALKSNMKNIPKQLKNVFSIFKDANDDPHCWKALRQVPAHHVFSIPICTAQ
jgi:hypothetical protein